MLSSFPYFIAFFSSIRPSTNPGALDVLQNLGASETPLAPSVAKAALICRVLKCHQLSNFGVSPSFSDKLTVDDTSIVCNI
jgi:hypothetical protein